ncbi:MAG: lysylphosphatidylglycerol synthase transmembrane domain-containing protein [Gemmatimonadaceae bacterium]
MTPRRWLLTALSFAMTIGVSVYIIVSGWPAAGAPLGLPWWAHVGAAGLVLFDLTARVLKIQLSARAVGVSVSFSTALRTSLGGDFAASITPSRSGAEPARFLVLKEAGYRVQAALMVIFMELLLELVSLLLITIGCFLLLDHSSAVVTALLAMVGGMAAFVLGGGTLAIWIARRHGSGPAPRWLSSVGVGPRAWRRAQASMNHLRDSMSQLRHAEPATMTAALGCSVIHVLTRLAILPVLVYAYGDRPPLAPLIVWPLAILYGSAVAPAPAGGGVVELSFRAALGSHIPTRLLASSLIWWRVYSFYAYLLLGAVSTGRTVMRALRPERSLTPELDTEVEQVPA